MAETLGSLCDKLTIVKLKQWHSTAPERLKSLALQEKQLAEEIDAFVARAASGTISPDRLTFAANKVYSEAKNAIPTAEGTIADLFSKLTEVNCELLQRNQCIDQIDRTFRGLVARHWKESELSLSPAITN